tara:strand:- start:759 stop:1532 length:774 start_codon:yes stop_codon:yes gene_type:complete
MVTLLLKKSYLQKDLKEIKFNDLWNSYGVFTTMRVIGKNKKILFFKDHINNLMKSIRIYRLDRKNLKKKIISLININLSKNKTYDHLLRVAINKKIISISLRKRIKPKSNFSLKLVNYQRIDPKYKNLKYKKILNFLKKLDTSKSDIALYKEKKILETGTSNLLFFQGNKIYSPIRNFYEGTTYKFFSRKLKKIKKKNISIDSLKNYDEIVIIGSGKGVVSVNRIDKTDWKRKSIKNYRFLSKIYTKAIKNCPRYNG